MPVTQAPALFPHVPYRNWLYNQVNCLWSKWRLWMLLETTGQQRLKLTFSAIPMYVHRHALVARHAYMLWVLLILCIHLAYIFSKYQCISYLHIDWSHGYFSLLQILDVSSDALQALSPRQVPPIAALKNGSDLGETGSQVTRATAEVKITLLNNVWLSYTFLHHAHIAFHKWSCFACKLKKDDYTCNIWTHIHTSLQMQFWRIHLYGRSVPIYCR